MHQSLTFFAFFFSFLSVHHLPCISSTRNSFSLKLIHRDSPLSPLYEPNISDFERFKNHVKMSKSRLLYFQRNNAVRLPLEYYYPFLTVRLGIGTPSIQRNLVFDTGSDLTWIQCQPCVVCFNQDQPLFNTESSSSYRKMPVNHELAKLFDCDSSECNYRAVYPKGQFSTGIASVETFTLKTGNGVPYKVGGLVFGCGTTNRGYYGLTKAITGILGMDRGPVSFAHQIGNKMIKSRFSYCLPKLKTSAKETYLRFGDDGIMRTKSYKSTPFLNIKNGSGGYILKLNDISIGGKRLRLGKSALRLRKNAFPNGCIIDSGSAVTHIEEKSYSAVAKSVKKYFSKFKKIERIRLGKGLEDMICYTNTRPVTNFPNMTFHFQGADLEVPPENLFRVERDFFCLEMLQSKNHTILGAYQQQNIRFLYDLDKDALSFVKEDCSKDAL